MLVLLFFSLFFLELLIIKNDRQNALWLLLLSLCFLPSILRCDVGVKLTMTDFTLLALFVSSFRDILKGDCIYTKTKSLFLMYGLYVTISTAIVIFGTEGSNYAKKIINFFMVYIATGFLLSYFQISENGNKKIDNILVIAYLIIAVYGIFNYISGYNPYILLVNIISGAEDMTDSFQEEIRGFLNGRISSTFIHPLELGQVSIILFSYFLFRKTSVHYTVRAIVLLLMMLMIVLCGSRSAIIPMVFVCFLYMLTKSVAKVYKYFIVIILLGSMVASQLPVDRMKELKGFLFF